MKSATLKIEGMHCEGCAQIIRALVGAEPGVRAAEVFFKEGQARILYESRTVTEEQLIKAIERGGFRVPAHKS